MSYQDAPKYLLAENGKCSYVVTEAMSYTSKAGNDLIKLKLEAEDEQGRVSTVYDYLMNQKLLKFLEMHHLPQDLNAHSDLRPLYGLKGHFINKYWSPSEDKKFNQVAYYLKPEGKKKEEESSVPFFDDSDIPF